MSQTSRQEVAANSATTLFENEQEWTKMGTEAWQAGDMIRDERLLPLPQELWHVVVAGLYLPETGERLPVSGTNRGKTGDQAILFK